MWKDIKKGVRLLKYSHQFKGNIAMSCFFLVLGMGMIIGLKEFVLGSLWFLTGIACVGQRMVSLLYAQLALSSPRRNGLELVIPSVMSWIAGIVGVVVLAVVIYVYNLRQPQLIAENLAEFEFACCLMVLCLIFLGTCNKHYIASAIILGISYVGLSVFGEKYLVEFFLEQIGSNERLAFGLGFVIVLTGCIVSQLLRLILGRKSFYKMMNSKER